MQFRWTTKSKIFQWEKLSNIHRKTISQSFVPWLLLHNSYYRYEHCRETNLETECAFHSDRTFPRNKFGTPNGLHTIADTIQPMVKVWKISWPQIRKAGFDNGNYRLWLLQQASGDLSDGLYCPSDILVCPYEAFPELISIVNMTASMNIWRSIRGALLPIGYLGFVLTKLSTLDFDSKHDCFNGHLEITQRGSIACQTFWFVQRYFSTSIFW